jgi:hypothetical protein
MKTYAAFGCVNENGKTKKVVYIREGGLIFFKKKNIMSDPFTRGFVGVAGMTVPGYAMSVTQPGRAPVGSNRLRPPGVSFGPDTRFLSRLGQDGDGLPKGKKNNVELQSNTFIINSYPIKIGQEGHELQIIEGMFVFMLSGTTSLKMDGLHISMYTPVSLGQLNMLLDSAWAKFREEVARGNNNRAKRVNELMHIVPESTFNHYVAINSPGAKVKMHPAFIDPGEHKEVEELYKLCKENSTYMLCVCPQAILHMFKFVGVVQNTSRNTTFDSYTQSSNNSIILSFGIIETGICEVHDVFTPTGEMQVGAKLWLHYRRRGYNMGFVVVPIVSKMNEHPHATGCYRDGAQVACNGLLSEIGTVLHNKDRDDYETTMRKASGVDPSGDLEQIKRATANTAKIIVDLQHLRH